MHATFPPKSLADASNSLRQAVAECIDTGNGTAWFHASLRCSPERVIHKTSAKHMDTITWDDFAKVQLRIGTVVSAEPFPEAHRPAYRLRVDFGPELGELKSSAQITELYALDELVGRQVVGVVNFPPKQIGPMRSECLITGFYRDDGAVVLAVPDQPVPNGAKLG